MGSKAMSALASENDNVPGPREGTGVPAAPAMTRCECAGLSFAEVERRLREGVSFEDMSRRTGCGDTCTACLPDLKAYLAGRR
jgi:bacterioferritin-associated ferredoxin